VEEVLQVIRNRLNADTSFPGRSPLQVEDVMELMDICLTTTYSQSEDQFYHQKECIAMGNSLSPVVSKIFMEHFEEIALDTEDYKPTKWFRYVDDTSWFGHMVQQDCRNFFTISTALDLPSNSLQKLKPIIPFRS
jgi:hypothetical protein